MCPIVVTWAMRRQFTDPQGATVDTTHAVVDASTSRAGLYVALTRGAKENHIWAVTETPVDETAEDMHYHLAGNPGPLEARDVVEMALSRDTRQRTARETHATKWAEAHSWQRRRDLYAYAVDGAIDAFIDATFDAYRRRGGAMKVPIRCSKHGKPCWKR